MALSRIRVTTHHFRASSFLLATNFRNDSDLAYLSVGQQSTKLYICLEITLSPSYFTSKLGPVIVFVFQPAFLMTINKCPIFLSRIHVTTQAFIGYSISTCWPWIRHVIQLIDISERFYRDFIYTYMYLYICIHKYKCICIYTDVS